MYSEEGAHKLSVGRDVAAVSPIIPICRTPSVIRYPLSWMFSRRRPAVLHLKSLGRLFLLPRVPPRLPPRCPPAAAAPRPLKRAMPDLRSGRSRLLLRPAAAWEHLPACATPKLHSGWSRLLLQPGIATERRSNVDSLHLAACRIPAPPYLIARYVK
jgi:hypothetical protein